MTQHTQLLALRTVSHTNQIPLPLYFQQPHADASNFSSTLRKSAAYAQLLTSLTSLVESQRNWVANTANAASLLWHMYHSLPSPSSSVNWSGFYVLDPTDPGKQLILGPFMGKVACQTIRIGKGVCGAAAEGDGRTVLVPDVEQFPGHIACDGDSRSEMVVPIKAGGKVCDNFKACHGFASPPNQRRRI